MNSRIHLFYMVSRIYFDLEPCVYQCPTLLVIWVLNSLLFRYFCQSTKTDLVGRFGFFPYFLFLYFLLIFPSPFFLFLYFYIFFLFLFFLGFSVGASSISASNNYGSSIVHHRCLTSSSVVFTIVSSLSIVCIVAHALLQSWSIVATHH